MTRACRSTLLSLCFAALAAPPLAAQIAAPAPIDLGPLRQQPPSANPYGGDFDYAAAFASLDLQAVKADIKAALTKSQPWWPADYGNYGPFFVRMAWHSAGTYRALDGRGGADGAQQRFEPLNSWPDNASLDKARRLLWPIKKKYGRKLSWADLIVLTGNVSLEAMGFKTFGFAGGRADDWQAEAVFWGPETKPLDDQRYSADHQLQRPLGAAQMGLIYVNPEGPRGNPDPVAAARDIRETFGRMGMNDEETAALIAGGHTFGKTHGAHPPGDWVEPSPDQAAPEQQGLGWRNRCGKGNGPDAITSGLEGAWTSSPIQWTSLYLDNLMTFEWQQTRSPGGAVQWIPTDKDAASLVPDPFDPNKRHAPVMLTTDLALKMDAAYRPIVERFRANPDSFGDAFARAWFKLMHRDMGPRWRYLGAEVPGEALIWQDPLPAGGAAPALGAADIADLKRRVLASGPSNAELVRAAWGAAASFRATDWRGGANGGRLRLAPQRDWAVNDPAELARVLPKLEAVRADFAKTGKQVSMADLIVLGGTAAIEAAARAGGTPIEVPFRGGRVDASQAQTDVAGFAALEPSADGFRNFYGTGNRLPAPQALIERASLLRLTIPEMTVLVGGLRALGATQGGRGDGVLTTRPGVLSTDYFVNLLDMNTAWTPSAGGYEGRDRASGKVKWRATAVDLMFSANTELRAVAEAYAADDARDQFARDFAAAWAKVMTLDLPPERR
ncbi:MAG: peroxidase [Proteobacteria bacterium SG_bin5]|nr:MAG: peroxidase [Proteobacteria bacterium SG_bin5]